MASLNTAISKHGESLTTSDAKRQPHESKIKQTTDPSAMQCTGTRTRGQITHWFPFTSGVAFGLACLGLISTSGVMWKRIRWVQPHTPRPQVPPKVVHRAIYPNHNADISVLHPSCNKQDIVPVAPLSQFIASGVQNSKYESVTTTF